MHFSDLPDPRRTWKGNFRHHLSDILLLSVSAMLCGASDWGEVNFFGRNQLGWLRKLGGFKNGVPSEDTLERVFSALSPKEFNRLFVNWMRDACRLSGGDVVAVDGKSMRGAADACGKMPHIVSAFASRNGLCLGQEKVRDKSNEIEAVPRLLALLELEGCVVTLDAMGCQRALARQIVGKGADYVLAVKGNQPSLERAVEDARRLSKPAGTDVWVDSGHGRVETRTCTVYDDLGHLECPGDWAGLKTLAVVESSTYDKASGKETASRRFYISSLEPDAGRLNRAVRAHWAVENGLHWTLDVTFGEDASRKRRGNSPENFSMMLKCTIALLAKDKDSKLSKKKKRLKAALDHEYREKLISG